MKKKYQLNPVILILSFTISFMLFMFWFKGFLGGRIKQDVREINYEARLETYVWKDGVIVASWFDPIDSCIKYPNLKKIRKSQAREVLKSLK